MDTSKEYIKMCEGAEKIQELRDKDKWELGDCFYSSDIIETSDGIRIIGNAESDYCADDGLRTTGDSCGSCEINGDIVWLPRQDQLQAIAGYSLPHGIGNLHDWMHDSPTRMEYLDTMEKLWLGVVMS